jgi:amino acid transporter
MMLSFEGISLVAVSVLGLLIWGHKGFALDTAQLTLKGASPGGILTAIVLVVFGFSGFESSTSLGAEAKNPLKSIPRSVIQSVVFSGAVFTFMAYVVVLGFQGSAADLGKADAPLNFLATSLGYGTLGIIINVGILLSFFSCTLACINSTARIVFSMARHGLFHDMLGHAHEKNETPHYAVFLSALLTFLIPTALYLSGISPFDGQGYFGTLCSFGFMLVYILISIAAPIYLWKIRQLRKMDLVYSVAGVGFMILPLIGTIGIPGSSLFPMPNYPNNILPWLFVAYMAIGLGFLLLQRFRYPAMIPAMKSNIRKVDVHFAEAEGS